MSFRLAFVLCCAALAGLGPPTASAAPVAVSIDAKGRLLAALPALRQRLGTGGATPAEVAAMLGATAPADAAEPAALTGDGLDAEVEVDATAGDVVELRLLPAAELGLRLADLEGALGVWELRYRSGDSAVDFAPAGGRAGEAAAVVAELEGAPAPEAAVRAITLVMPEPLRRAWVVPSLPPAADGSVRFVDLERLYFKRLDHPGRRLGSPVELAAMLPPSLDLEPPASPEPAVDEESELDLAVEDFPLALAAGQQVLLRQVVDFRHPRITEQYWALYADGELVDLWFFSPMAASDDGGKVLTPLQVEGVRQPAAAELELRTCGSMARPQGAWWAHQRELGFAATAGALRLTRVVARFVAGQGYDLGTIPPIWVSTESRQGDHLVQRKVDPAPPRLLRRCGFEAGLDCEAMLRAAECVTRSSAAKRSVRGLDEPSFVERGGHR